MRNVRRSSDASRAWTPWGGPVLPVVLASALLCLGIANISARATWHAVEDGVLWTAQADGVVASDIARGTSAAAVGIRRGDLLLAIDDRPVQQVADIEQLLQGAAAGQTARYTILRLGTREVVDVRIAPIPSGPRALYFFLAAVGIFTLVVGAAVRLRRPRDPATLHFFWLAVAFFGVFTFSFSGRLDRLDWVFYWGDAVSMLLLPPLFLHFTLVFPERARRWTAGRVGRVIVPLVYVPAALLGIAHIVALARGGGSAAASVRALETLDRFEFLYLAGCLIAGLAALARALTEVRSITGRRQLRWIAWGTALGGTPFALGYALPYAFGVNTTLPMQLSAIPLGLIPLAYASAIVRYRLMDIEVIVKRALVYAAALVAIVAIYALMLQGVERVWLKGDQEHNWVIAFLATLVALLLAPPVKNAVQNALDRAFYRDRYDYRRALVGFARDLNSDLDLHRLAERLV
ncbi:MAG TPA: PDZ domain-containing protein, partial [Vicinamibacterales bacterium]|nr:PDZ domain-containing protein [Vicinamibacterales bacterium]